MRRQPTITIALDWKANTNHTGLLVALHRGLLAATGYAVHILPPEADRGPAALVVAGEADLAFAFEGTVLERRALGEPLVAVAAVCQHNVSSLVALKGSGITRPADFGDKRYASFGHPQLERGVIQRMMATDGAPNADFALTEVRFASIDLLTGGQYDFLWVYDAVEMIEAAQHGIELVAFSPMNYGVPDYYAPMIFAHEAALIDPDRKAAATSVMGAIRQGYAIAAADPAGVLVDIDATAPSLGGWLFADMQTTFASQTIQSQHYTPTGSRWGEQTLAMWTAFPRFLHEIGVLPELSDHAILASFTNDLVQS